MTTPVPIFISSAPTPVDQELHAELGAYLAAVMSPGLAIWNPQRAADEEHDGTPTSLVQARVVLLLVSIDYLSSATCRAEVDRALARHEAGEAHVIPILARACPWEQRPFAKLQSLPLDGVPLTTSRNRDEAWTSVARQIRAVTERVTHMQRTPAAKMMERQTEAQATSPAFVQGLIDEEKAGGFRDGKLEGLREALLELLARAGISLAVGDRVRIRACADAATLRKWIGNVLGAKTVADVLS